MRRAACWRQGVVIEPSTGVHGLQHIQVRRRGIARRAMRSGRIRRACNVARVITALFAFNVRRPRLQANDVVLLQLQLGRILNGHDPLVVRIERTQRGAYSEGRLLHRAPEITQRPPDVVASSEAAAISGVNSQLSKSSSFSGLGAEAANAQRGAVQGPAAE